MVLQRKTQRPVQFELTQPTRAAVATWIEKARLRSDECLFPSRIAASPHVSTRQYARIVHQWVEAAGLDSSAYGAHSMRRMKATLIYKQTKNLGAVQLLLGHIKLPYATSASRWMTRWRFLSRLKSKDAERPHAIPCGRFLASCRMRASGHQQSLVYCVDAAGFNIPAHSAWIIVLRLFNIP